VPIYQDLYGTNLPDNPVLGDRAGQAIDYVPLMAVTYWGFRIMIGFGGLAAIAAAIALWITRKGTVPQSKWLMRLAVLGILAPLAASAAGWVFTEMGRQPFVVAPNPTPGGIDGVFMFTASAVSPGVEPWEIIFSLVALTLVYLALLVVEVSLLWKYARAGVAGVMPELAEHHDDTDKNDDVLAFAY
jgi:cytochrome d ubiquinol oxidase subunit I